MKKLSWQTALLMNASGNLKKSIKPTDLYNPDEAEEPEKASYSNLTDEEKAKKKEELRTELLNSFNL